MESKPVVLNIFEKVALRSIPSGLKIRLREKSRPLKGEIACIKGSEYILFEIPD